MASPPLPVTRANQTAADPLAHHASRVLRSCLHFKPSGCAVQPLFAHRLGHPCWQPVLSCGGLVFLTMSLAMTTTPAPLWISSLPEANRAPWIGLRVLPFLVWAALAGLAWLFFAFCWGTRTCSAFQVPSLGPHMRTEPPAPAPASCVDSDMPASVPAVDTGHYQAVCSRPVPTPCRNFRMPDCPWPLLADDDSEAGDDDHDLDFAVLAGPGEAPTLGLGGISALVFRTLLREAVSAPSCAALAVAAATLSALAEAFPSPCAPAQSVHFPSGPSEPKNQGFGAFPEKTARQEGEIPNPSSFLGRFSLAESRAGKLAAQSNPSVCAGPRCLTLADKIALRPLLPVTSAWPARDVARAQDASQPLRVGSAALPFTWQQLSELFEQDAAIFDFEEASRFCPELLRWQLPAILTELDRANTGRPTRSLICYTDGSFADHQHGETICGWACVYFDPGVRALGFLCGAFPTYLVGHDFSASPFQGEVAGLLAAALSAVAAFGHREVLFLSDCTSALGIAAGTYAHEPGSFGQTLRHAHSFRHCVTGRSDAYDHIRGHKGHAGNELADLLAKAAAKRAKASCGLLASRHTLSCWLGWRCHAAPRLAPPTWAMTPAIVVFLLASFLSRFSPGGLSRALQLPLHPRSRAPGLLMPGLACSASRSPLSTFCLWGHMLRKMMARCRSKKAWPTGLAVHRF